MSAPRASVRLAPPPAVEAPKVGRVLELGPHVCAMMQSALDRRSHNTVRPYFLISRELMVSEKREFEVVLCEGVGGRICRAMGAAPLDIVATACVRASETTRKEGVAVSATYEPYPSEITDWLDAHPTQSLMVYGNQYYGYLACSQRSWTREAMREKWGPYVPHSGGCSSVEAALAVFLSTTHVEDPPSEDDREGA